MLPRITVVTAIATLTGVFALAAATARAADAPATAPANLPQPKVLRLWEGDAPGAKGNEDTKQPSNDVPTITVYSPAPDQNNGAAIVICPGGGYGHLADHEGKPVADWLNAHGATGIVLKYRLAPKYHHPAMIVDVQRAIRATRFHAKEWGIDANRVGVLGFSAGGHLASSAATHFDKGDQTATDPVEKQSCRPDIAVLVYPVITLQPPFAHMGSRNNLLGPNPDPKLVEMFSNETQVTDQTPPTYLVHSSDDHGVPVENTLLFAMALSKHKVPFGMRIFDHGGHGFGMGTKDPELSTWPQSCYEWLEHRGFFKKS